jgi:hypothetical protein
VATSSKSNNVMSNYLLELESEIIFRWPDTYDKLRKSHSDHIITSFGICVKKNPSWYIYAEFNQAIITIDLYIMEQRSDFNHVFWSLNAAPPPTDIKGVQHIQTYWVKPDEVKFGYETIHLKPGDNPNKEGASIMTVGQIVRQINTTFFTFSL